jgi:hypothetical protein
VTLTDKTITQNLTRTTATDDPKQMHSYLGTLAEEVDRRVNAHRYDLRRVQNRPFAVLRSYGTQVYDAVASSAIPFNAVEEDTADLVDLSVSNTLINLRTTGWWCVGSYVQCTGFGAANSDVVLHLNAGPGGILGIVRDQAIGLAALSVHTMVEITVPDTYTARTWVDWSGSSVANTTFLQFAEMWAYKVRDL